MARYRRHWPRRHRAKYNTGHWEHVAHQVAIFDEAEQVSEWTNHSSPTEDIAAATETIRRSTGARGPERLVMSRSELARVIRECDANGTPVPDELRAAVVVIGER